MPPHELQFEVNAARKRFNQGWVDVIYDSLDKVIEEIKQARKDRK